MATFAPSPQAMAIKAGIVHFLFLTNILAAIRKLHISAIEYAYAGRLADVPWQWQDQIDDQGRSASIAAVDQRKTCNWPNWSRWTRARFRANF